MSELTLAQSLNGALATALETEERVVLLGEDIGRTGGVFRITDGLRDKYGEHRVFDTPVAESGIVGAAFGMAIAGMLPVAELQFLGQQIIPTGTTFAGTQIGGLSSVAYDAGRDRFYVLDAQNFKVLVFDSNTMTKIAEFRTGNSPTAMTISQDDNYLAVANSRGEHVSLVDLNQLTPDGYAYIPWREISGRYPYAIVTDASRMMIRSSTISELGADASAS